MDRKIAHQVVRNRRLRQAAYWLPAVAALWALWFWAPDWLRSSVHHSRIRTAQVERGDLEAVLQAAGTVEPAFETVLSSPVEARVVSVLKRPGDVVHRGDEILMLDTSATELELTRLEEQIARKENEEEQLRLSLEKSLIDIQSRLDSKRLDAEIAEYRLEQKRKLWSDGLTSEAELRQAEVELRKVRIELAQLEDSLESAQRSTDAQVQGIALDIRLLRKEGQEARRRLELATTRSDREGVLTWVVLEEGTTVGRGDVIARIADLESFRVEATVSDVHASRLSVGMPARAVKDGEILSGIISSVHPTIENGVARFTVELDESSHPDLRHNLRVDVLAVTERRSDVLKIRKGPFAKGGSLQEVFVIRGDRAFRTDARFGLSGYEHFEVEEGLEEGDEIIISSMMEYIHLDEIRIKGLPEGRAGTP